MEKPSTKDFPKIFQSIPQLAICFGSSNGRLAFLLHYLGRPDEVLYKGYLEHPEVVYTQIRNVCLELGLPVDGK